MYRTSSLVCTKGLKLWLVLTPLVQDFPSFPSKTTGYESGSNWQTPEVHNQDLYKEKGSNCQISEVHGKECVKTCESCPIHMNRHGSTEVPDGPSQVVRHLEKRSKYGLIESKKL